MLLWDHPISLGVVSPLCAVLCKLATKPADSLPCCTSSPSIPLFHCKGGFNTSVEDYQALLSLARSQGAVGGQNRGACKICGQLGHLTKQCRNHLSAHFQLPGSADGGAAAVNGKPLMPTLPVVDGDDADLSSDLSDLDSSSSDSDSSSESEDERRKRKVYHCLVAQFATSLLVLLTPSSLGAFYLNAAFVTILAASLLSGRLVRLTMNLAGFSLHENEKLLRVKLK